MMAARNVLLVLNVLFLFFTGRGGSFLSPKEKEKNGGAKRSGRERKEWVQKSVSSGAEETGKSGRTESSTLHGAAEDRRLHGCVGTAPRPSSVCFADTFPGGEGIPLRRGRADRVVRPYKVQRRTQGCTVSVGCCLTAIIKIACGA